MVIHKIVIWDRHYFIYANSQKEFWDDLYVWFNLKHVIRVICDFDFKTIKYVSFSFNYDGEFFG